jgi:hypothetical protein
VRWRGGVDGWDGGALWWTDKRSMERDFWELPLGPEHVVVTVGMGPREGESSGRREAVLLRLDFRGEELRAMLRRGVGPFTESKLPWESSCRQFMMRSLGGCVDVLSLLARPNERILFERPTLEPARLEKTDAASQLSVRRFRLACAQSCRKTLIEPVKSAVTIIFPSVCAERATYAGLSATLLKVISAGVGRADPASVGGFEPFIDSARDMSVMGGGLQRSKIGSSDAESNCLVLSGAMIAHVVIELCASNISTGRWLFFSPSGVVVDHMYAFRSSLPHIICPVSSANVALI